MRTRTRTSIVLGAVLAAALIGTIAAPANAAARVAYGELVPTVTVPAVPANGPCTTADTDARITQAYPAQWPKDSVKGVNSATSKVLINLDSLGNLVSARIANSSGNALLDDEALTAARGSKYAPEFRNCNSFARSYYLDVMFINQMSFVRQFLPTSSTGRPFAQRHV
jgi:TonB family protein